MADMVEIKPLGGVAGDMFVGACAAFSETPADEFEAAPAIGEHSGALLAEAGLSAQEIAALFDRGAVGGAR